MPRSKPVLLLAARASRAVQHAATALGGALALQAQAARWFSQRLDHFNANDTRADQRFYMDETHFRAPGGPVFRT